MKEFKSLIDEKCIEELNEGYPYQSYFSYVSNLVSIDRFIAAAGMIFPALIEQEGYIFLKENYPMLKGKLACRFGDDKRTVERYVNLFCIADFYLMAADENSNNENNQRYMAEILKTGWQTKLKLDFPGRLFEFEIGNNLFDESGLCITFYENLGA